MADPIEELVQRWKRNPSPATTVALCDALRGNPRGPLVQQVGEFATQRHGGDVAVLVSVARMYMETHRFADAQTVLVAAGKQAPRDAQVYRWLGEVLLRRGDAERAEKVMERAIQLGSRDPAAPDWLARARALRPMQAKAGVRAVAAEVALAHAHVGRDLFDSISDNTTDVKPLPPLALGSLTEPEAPLSPPPSLAARGLGPPPLPRAPDSDSEWSEVSEISEVTGPSPAKHAPAPTGPQVPKNVVDSVVPKPRTNGAHPAPMPLAARPASPPPRTGGGAVVPHPRDVLDALALAGVYEPNAKGAGATWDRPGKGPRRKGAPTLVAAMVLFLAGSVGTYFFYRHKRALDHAQAEALLDSVEATLREAKPDALPDAERALARALALETRSPRAALDWARERAMVGLVKSGADVAFEDAMARAKEVGVPEEKYAFARVASFLFQGDNAGAAAVLPRWDGPAASDAYYQAVAGATLERAGDGRDRDRYASATKDDPSLFVAQVGLVRTTAIRGDVQEAMRLAKELRIKMPDRAEPIALVALAWGRDPARDEDHPPPEADEVSKRAAELPSGLKFVPSAIAALRAVDRHAPDEARTALQAGLAQAEAPGAAVWLGAIALPLGDEGLARKAALAALQLSAVYEPARALAARVALLGGRLDEALKATDELDPTSTDVAVVRAASAYERVDADGVARALEAIPPAARKLPQFDALSMGPDVLAGRVQQDGARLVAMASNDDPWDDLVAIDVALDSGDLPTADKVAALWGKGADAQPLRAVRLARLARYEGRLDEADALSQSALDHGTVTPRVLWERAFALVARNKSAEVGPLLARYPLVLGPVATWLSAYAVASGGGIEAAKGRTSAVDPPPAMAPLAVRVVTAAALGAMKDRRRGAEFVRSVLTTGSLHPDLVAAALALGFHKIDRGRRRPLYE
ncbi:MAG TPA: tetratricopeptide repeat protein [Polyangiaceae bacterium]|nr:tetratricopeptide repeat protein [Polyangiaceae bacterium]